jgi:hypothetical protein
MKSFLFLSISFVALTSTLSGIVMMSVPDGVILNLPLSLLKDTPFKTYFLPGLLLTVIVGGTNFMAVYYNLIVHPKRYNWAMAAGLVLCIWMLGQISLFNAIFWIDVIMILIGLMIFLIAYQLRGKMLV